jgi:hypothetical protein
MRKISLKLQRPRVILLLVLAAGGLVGLVPFTAGQAREGCSTETIRGEYGFRTAGAQLRPDGTRVDFASIGRFVRDGHGNVVSGEVTANAGGTISRVTLTGTYTVNPDCTGSQTSILNTGAVVHFDFLIVDNGKRVELLIISPTSVIGGTQTKQ